MADRTAADASKKSSAALPSSTSEAGDGHPVPSQALSPGSLAVGAQDWTTGVVNIILLLLRLNMFNIESCSPFLLPCQIAMWDLSTW